DVEVFPISAATGEGIRPLLLHVKELLDSIPLKEIVFEKEIDNSELFDTKDEPFYVEQDPDDPHKFLVTGPRIDRMLGYTNLESEKGFLFFQEFMENNNIINELKDIGLEEGDTVQVGDYLEFEYLDGKDYE
ncbi:MAG: Obg family GTPase CgtA, partial [Clostridiales bacterium]|nr:Obg family GTPase CgtA [Clostridiales bacterium]